MANFTALNIAATGMIAQDKKVDDIANNIANASTDGFKKSFTQFYDLSYHTEKRPGLPVGDGDQRTPVGVQFGRGVAVGATIKSFKVGTPINREGNPLTAMIDGAYNNFFIVTLPDGRRAYTRNGNFEKNGDTGRLETTMGHPIEDEIIIPADAQDFNIARNGEVFVKFSNQTELENVGRIRLARFVNPAGLEAIGDNLFIETDASGEAVDGDPTDDNFASIKQYWIESSNVQIINEVVDLIKAHQTYSMNSKIIQTEEKMMEEVARIKSA